MTAHDVQTAATAPETGAVPEPAHGAEIVVPLNRLKASPRNARKVKHSAAAIEALAASIRAKGVLQAPVVEIERDREGATTGNYLVTIGEGRRQALRMLVKRKAIMRTHPVKVVVDTLGRFGDEAYAREELVAELGAAFVCADLGLTLEPRPDHAAYIASWLRVLRNDSAHRR